MKREKTSVSQEDYLKQIWEIVQEEQIPISARLAEDLAVTPPAVTAALKRMTRGGFLRVERSGRIELTPKGRKIAQHLVVRHRLAEKLLTDVIGIEWSRAHEEAERLEHGVSLEAVRLLLKRFGREARCPHGVPLVGGMSELRRRYGAVPLSEAPAGQRYEILRVYEREPDFLNFVAGLKLLPGARVRVLKREYDETMTVLVAGSLHKIYLGKPATAKIWVRPAR
ncbi:MAG TPA: metal-dependent transcriptional regulator [Candidatus Acidoferrales bacterium]|nr:metal-dependent transcriptional regulator [Candidatus Acidoferrales bacterium]HEV2342313.1 metal-dependent transcriptional regulator [Candidatus Acidoferrales bacterium]